ncbi:MAG: C10 family peptidase [Muribaculaceae bacterium]|nr:C10 family peptidase [Muribaculaceae bacterium]
MRRLLLLSILLTVMTAYARQISPQEAASVASEFINSRTPLTRSADSAVRINENADDSAPQPYYVFNSENGNGFVIVSGDDRFSKILGYSDRGSFSFNNLPPQLKAMLDNFAKKSTDTSTSTSVHPSWSKKLSTRADETVKLYPTAEWGQGYPFNALTPKQEGWEDNAPAGCVATAMAITMQYHQWPDYTRGGEAVDFYFPDEKFDFDNYTIDWEALKDKENPKFNDEAAKLLYSAGVAVHMMFGPKESGSEVWAVSHKLIEYFTYAKGCEYIERDMFNEEEWNSILRQQLDEVGPVIYSGAGSGAHCFVIDGYDNEGLYHVNWGWDGNANAFYTLDFSITNDTHYEENQGMIVNIKPDKERKEWSKAWVPNVPAYIPGLYDTSGWNFEKVNIIPDDPIKYKVPVVSLNGYEGEIALAVADENDNILKIIEGTGASVHGKPTYCPYPGSAYIAGTTSFPAIEDGQRYQIVARKLSQNEDDTPQATSFSLNPEDYEIVLGGSVIPSYFYATGNHSEIAEITIKIPENLPFVPLNEVPYQNEYKFTELKGDICPFNIKVPKENVKLEVEFWDKDGNSLPPMVNDGYYLDSNSYLATISVFADRIEAQYIYEPVTNTRRDSELAEDEIIEKSGLVYKKVEEGGVNLIGYDNPDEEIVISDIVKDGENEYKLMKIEANALLHAPIKHLILSTKDLKYIDEFAFAGMNSLESVTLEGFNDEPLILNNLDSWNSTLLRKSSFKDVYCDGPLSWWSQRFIFSVNLIAYSFDCEYRNQNIHLSYVPFSYDSDLGFRNYFDYLNEYHASSKEIPLINSYNVPGSVKKCIGDEFNLPIKEMWSFDIDKEAGLISIDDIADNIKINAIRINDEEAEENTEGFYEFPLIQRSLPEIEVDYTVNGHRKMKSIYKSTYLDNLPSTQLSTTGITNIEDKGKKLVDIYNLQGILLYSKVKTSDLPNLTPGFYIIDGKKVRVK